MGQNNQHPENWRVVGSFSAPRPVIDALRANAAARGISISAVIREALVAQGITPQTR